MRNVLIIYVLILSNACASSYVSYQSIEKPKDYYQKIFVVTLFNDILLKEFNEETYNSYIRDYLNNIDAMDRRNVMEHSLKNTIANSRTILTNSKDQFKVNVDVDYNDFMMTLNDFESEAILVINEKAYYYNVSERINCNGDIRTTESPNAEFHAYLIDAKSLQPVWVGKIHSTGSQYDYTGSMYNSMCRKLNKKLIKEKFLMPALKQ